MKWSRSPPSTIPRPERYAGRTLFSYSPSAGCGCVIWATSGSRLCGPSSSGAIGAIDLLFIPVGGGPTIDASQAAAITRALQPRWVVPMHYGNRYVDFVAPPDAFLAEFESVTSLETNSADLTAAPADGALHVVHLAPPPPS